MEATERPSQITAAHLGKLAVVYIRQSSPEQVRSNTGSTEDQRGLVELPRRWGWPESRIHLIDDDLGRSGTTDDRRSGFHAMLELIEQGHVGLVVVREVSRLSRDPFLAETFLKTAIRSRVLIFANGRMFDSATGELAELFGIRIQNLLAWWENQSRSQNMLKAKAAKVRQGYAVAGRPLGYVLITRGKWVKDPDAAVRDAVQRVFDLALEGQSIGKVLRYMDEHQLQLPRRVRGQLVWESPARSNVANILSNPNYTPDYFYRRHRAIPGAPGRSQKMEARPASEWLVFRDHHEGFVSREQWQLIQDALKSRRPRLQPPLGKGGALLQGRMWCPQCDHWMYTSYHRRRGDRRLPSYLCRQGNQRGGPSHHVVGAAEVIDGLVVPHVLAALGTVDPETAIMVIEQAQSEEQAVRASRNRLLQRADADVEVACQRYAEVGAEHPLVKADLLARYEEALARRDRRTEEIRSAPAGDDVAFTSEDGVQLTALTQQLEALWAAPTTTTEDRKQLMRLVLQRVIVVTSTIEELELELVWAGGLRERIHVHRRAELDMHVRDLRNAGTRPAAIVRALQTDGVPSITGKPASRDVVRRSLERVGLNRAALRHRVLTRLRELVLEQRSRKDIMRILDEEFPRDRGQWTHSHLYRAVRRLEHGAPGVPLLPDGLLDKPDTTQAIALVEQWRKNGKTWKKCAHDLNAMGLHPARAATFSLFQVMELIRRRRGHEAGRREKATSGPLNTGDAAP